MDASSMAYHKSLEKLTIKYSSLYLRRFCNFRSLYLWTSLFCQVLMILKDSPLRLSI